MFTGIIEAVGTVRKQGKKNLWIDIDFTHELKAGQSIACNGACLTVVKKDKKGFQVELLEESKRLTNLAQLKKGDQVNLERAMRLSDRLDGHLVQGHVEGVGKIVSLRGAPQQARGDEAISSNTDIPDGIASAFLPEKPRNDIIFRLEVPKSLFRYMILKGIVILDGIALTITKIDDKKSEIELAIIPYTWENTNLHEKKVGDILNIETDVIAKYVEKLG